MVIQQKTDNTFVITAFIKRDACVDIGAQLFGNGAFVTRGVMLNQRDFRYGTRSQVFQLLRESNPYGQQ